MAKVFKSLGLTMLLLPIILAITGSMPITLANDVDTYSSSHYIILVNTTPVPSIIHFDYTFTSLNDALYNLSQIDGATGYSWAVIYVNNEFFNDYFNQTYSLHDLSIIGIGSPIINASTPWTSLVFEDSNNITIDNLVFTNFTGFKQSLPMDSKPLKNRFSISQYYLPCTPAVFINGSTGITVQNLILANSCIAIGILNSTLTTVNNVTIYNASITGIYGSDINSTVIKNTTIIPLTSNPDSTGMLFNVTHYLKNYDLTIRDVIVLSTSWESIYISDTNNVFIDNLWILYSDYDGLGMFYSNNITISNYYAYGIGYSGIYADYISNVTLTNISIDGFVWYGFEIYDSWGIQACNVSIYDGFTGLYLWNISDSSLEYMDLGLFVDNGIELNLSDHVTLYSVDISDPRIGLLVNGSSNIEVNSITINDTWDKAVYINASKYINISSIYIHNATNYGIYINSSVEINISSAEIDDVGNNAVCIANSTDIDLYYFNVQDIDRTAFYVDPSVDIYMESISICNITLGHGIEVYNSTYINIQDSFIYNTSSGGILLYNVSMANLTNTTIISVNDIGIRLINSSNILIKPSFHINDALVGIYLYGSENVTIGEYTSVTKLIENTVMGINIQYSNNVKVLSTKVKDSGSGVRLGGSSHIEIGHLSALNVGVGIDAYIGFDIYIHGTQVTNASLRGMLFDHVTDLALSYNNIYNVNSTVHGWAGLVIMDSNDISMGHIWVHYLNNCNGIDISDSWDIFMWSITVEYAADGVGILLENITDLDGSEWFINNVTSGDGIKICEESDSIRVDEIRVNNVGLNGIRIDSSVNVFIDNSIYINDTSTGIYVRDSDNVSIGSYSPVGIIANSSTLAINIYRSSNVKLLNLNITIASKGVLVHGSENITMKDLNIYDIMYNGINVMLCNNIFTYDINIFNAGSYAVDMHSVNTTYINNLTIWDSDGGLLFHTMYSSVNNNITVYNIYIRDISTYYGIYVSETNNLIIKNATVSYLYTSAYGIVLDHVKDAEIDPILIHDVGGGLSIKDSINVLINDLTIYNCYGICGYGLYIDNGTNIHGNRIMIFNVSYVPIMVYEGYNIELNNTYPGLLKYFLNMKIHGIVTIYNMDYSTIPSPTGGLIPAGIYMDVSMGSGSWLWLNYTFNPAILSTKGIAPRTLSWWYWNEYVSRWRSIPSVNIIVTPYVGYAIGNYSSTGTIIGVFGGPPAVGGEVIGSRYNNDYSVYLIFISIALAAIMLTYLAKRHR